MPSIDFQGTRVFEPIFKYSSTRVLGSSTRIFMLKLNLLSCRHSKDHKIISFLFFIIHYFFTFKSKDI